MGMNIGMNTVQRSARSAPPTVTIRRLPASGNTALAASALIQAALGIEFFLSGLNKFADPNFVRNFKLFVDASPGTHTGVLAPLIRSLVLPNLAFFAGLTAFAGLAAAGLSLSIALLMGEQLPTITPGRALTTAIPVELLLVPLGIAVAWMELGRFRVLHRPH